MKKNNTQPMPENYDYKNPIKIEEITFIEISDNGRSKFTKFKYNDTFFVQEYKYGAAYGFKFITEYNSETAFNHPLTATGSAIIYSSTLQSDCTEFGKYLEYSLMKMKIPATVPTPTQPTAQEQGKHVLSNLHLASDIAGDEYACNILSEEPNALVAQAKVSVYFTPEQAEANAAELVKRWNECPKLQAENEKLKQSLGELLEYGKKYFPDFVMRDVKKNNPRQGN